MIVWKIKGKIIRTVLCCIVYHKIVDNDIHMTAPHECLVTTFWPCDLDLWPIDLIFIGGRGIALDYLCTSLAILVSAILVLSCGQTDRQTESPRLYTHTTTVGVCQYHNNNMSTKQMTNSYHKTSWQQQRDKELQTVSTFLLQTCPTK